jgi:hypothetical protein
MTRKATKADIRATIAAIKAMGLTCAWSDDWAAGGEYRVCFHGTPKALGYFTDSASVAISHARYLLNEKMGA